MKPITPFLSLFVAGALATLCPPRATVAQSLSSHREAVVFITAILVDTDGSRHVKKSGTGVVVSEGGHIVTTAHGVPEAAGGQPLEYYAAIGSRHGRAYPIHVIKRDNELDIALAKLPYLRDDAKPKVANLRSLERKDLDGKVFIFGFPGSSDLPSAEGQLSSDFGPKGYWQTSLPMTFGNSGGPVLDTSGYVIGLAVGGTVDGRTYIIPANYLRGLLDLVGVVLYQPESRKIAENKPETKPETKPKMKEAKPEIKPEISQEIKPEVKPQTAALPSCLDSKADLTIEDIKCMCFQVCAAASAPAPRRKSDERRFDTYDGRDIDGHDLKEPLRQVGLDGCVEACKGDPACKAFSYDKWNKMCFLKDTVPRSFRVEPNSVVAVPAKATIKVSTAPIEIERFADALFVDEGFRELSNTNRDSCEAACKRETRCQVYTFFRENRTCRLIEYPSEYFRKKLSDKRTPNPKYVIEADSGVKRQKPD